MTDSSDRDPVVADALAMLPVSDHGPDFWTRLDRSLAAVDAERSSASSGVATTAVGGDHDPAAGRDEGLPPPIDLRPTGTPRPARRWAFMAVAAAAALVAVAVVGSTLALDDGGDLDLTTSQTTGTAPSIAPVTTAPPASAPGGAGPAVEPESAEEAVFAWVDALGAGDGETAVALLGPGSIDYIESLGQEPVSFMSELSEGYGAWSASTDRSTTDMPVPSESGATVAVVVLMGTVQQEGTTAYRTVAVPVRSEDGRYRVEPVALGDGETRIEFVSPPEGPDGLGGLPADGVIELLAPGAEQVAVRLDGGEVQSPEVGAGGRVRFDPPGEMTSRTHLLVVASVGPGFVTAAAVTFLVEG